MTWEMDVITLQFLLLKPLEFRVETETATFSFRTSGPGLPVDLRADPPSPGRESMDYKMLQHLCPGGLRKGGVSITSEVAFQT